MSAPTLMFAPFVWNPISAGPRAVHWLSELIRPTLLRARLAVTPGFVRTSCLLKSLLRSRPGFTDPNGTGRRPPDTRRGPTDPRGCGRGAGCCTSTPVDTSHTVLYRRVHSNR